MERHNCHLLEKTEFPHRNPRNPIDKLLELESERWLDTKSTHVGGQFSPNKYVWSIQIQQDFSQNLTSSPEYALKKIKDQENKIILESTSEGLALLNINFFTVFFKLYFIPAHKHAHFYTIYIYLQSRD